MKKVEEKTKKEREISCKGGEKSGRSRVLQVLPFILFFFWKIFEMATGAWVNNSKKISTGYRRLSSLFLSSVYCKNLFPPSTAIPPSVRTVGVCSIWGGMTTFSVQTSLSSWRCDHPTRARDGFNLVLKRNELRPGQLQANSNSSPADSTLS